MSEPTPQAPNHLNHNVIVVVDDDEEIGTLITELIQEQTTHEVQHHVTGNQTRVADDYLDVADGCLVSNEACAPSSFA